MPLIDAFNGIKVYAGNLPANQLKKVQDWLSLKSVQLLNLCYEFNPDLI